MNYHNLLMAGLAFSFLTGKSLHAAPGQAQNGKNNVIIFLVDDMGWMDMIRNDEPIIK